MKTVTWVELIDGAIASDPQTRLYYDDEIPLAPGPHFLMVPNPPDGMGKGWVASGDTFSPPPPPRPIVIPALDYLMRFTQEEMQSILSAAVVTATQGNAALLAFITKLNTAQTIDLTNPMVIDGINSLVAAGLLTQERGQQILAP